ncbi:hypothetical protein IEO21_09982 [Rhodonia placenta]|uniref:Uncharacterized protein n=1 Tax=Rhodonia placenta TaxID=104341 RepID=A0A8H7TXQ9_9APHY|nr:hypothetical protein IEO21_09982 [Postia placenta]
MPSTVSARPAAGHRNRALPARAMTAGLGSACPNVYARPREAGAPQQCSFARIPGRERDYGTVRRTRPDVHPWTDAPPSSTGRNAPTSSATLIATVATPASHAASPHNQCRTRACARACLPLWFASPRAA